MQKSTRSLISLFTAGWAVASGIMALWLEWLFLGLRRYMCVHVMHATTVTRMVTRIVTATRILSPFFFFFELGV